MIQYISNSAHYKEVLSRVFACEGVFLDRANMLIIIVKMN